MGQFQSAGRNEVALVLDGEVAVKPRHAEDRAQLCQLDAATAKHPGNKQGAWWPPACECRRAERGRLRRGLLHERERGAHRERAHRQTLARRWLGGGKDYFFFFKHIQLEVSTRRLDKRGPGHRRGAGAEGCT